jgi:predicted O-linked N-acetylglucosamine transferase (SPINDLY family)
MTSRNDPCPCGSGKKFKKCCADKPTAPTVHSRNAPPASKRLLEAVALHQAGELDAAAAIYRDLLQADSGDSNALHYLGLIAFQRGDFAQAVELIEAAIVGSPLTPAFHCNLGNARQRQGQADAARLAYAEALRLDPRFVAALVGMAQAELACGAAVAATALARQALGLAPQLPEAWVCLGDALFEEELIDEAEGCFRQALVLRPGQPPVLVKRADILARFGRLDEAAALLDEALQCDPDYEPAHQARLMHLNYHCADPQVIFAAHREWARRFAAQDGASALHGAVTAADGRRLRVGYLSADFRRHALRFFIRPILRHHDRRRVEVFCYYNDAKVDDVTAELRGLAEHWIECASLSDAALAQRIHDDGIDVLVDLSGHSHGNRLKALAMKPAPVQATMLGYLNTTGLTAMDYRIVDAQLCPPGAFEAYHTETLARLPHCHWCFEPDAVSEVAPSPAAARGYVTFGCLHNLAKLTPAQLAVFSAILQRLPTARLLMVVWGETPRRALEQHFAAAGVATRVDFAAPRAHHDYLNFYADIDISLDTQPYAGGTTSLESLWMGVPVVTRRGTTPAGNGGVAILSTLGLYDWIGGSAQDSVDIAVRQATDIAGLTQLREALRARLEASPLMQAVPYVDALETFYAEAFAAAAAGMSPAGSA